MKNLVIAIFALGVILFSSCEKNDIQDSPIMSEAELNLISTDASVEDVSGAMDYEVDQYTSSLESIESLQETALKSTRPAFGRRYLLGVEPDITVLPEGDDYPKTITIDYGEGMELNNGRIISGIITIQVSAAPRTNGATRVLSFEDFSIDSIQIVGSRTYTFTGTSDTDRVFTCESKLQFTFADGEILNCTGEHTRSLIAGFDTPGVQEDDTISITGSVLYSWENGDSFTKEIIDPLIKTGGCRYIVQGVVSFPVRNINIEEIEAGYTTAELDYGDGSCDDIATITRNGESRQITIGRRSGLFK